MRLASGSQSQSTARHASFTRRSICSSGSLIVGLDTHCDDSKSQIVAVSNVGRPAVIGESTDDVLCLRLIRGARSYIHAPLLSHASSVIRHQPEVGSLKWPGVDEAAQGWIFEPRRLLDGLLPARPVAGGHEGLEYQNMVGPRH